MQAYLCILSTSATPTNYRLAMLSIHISKIVGAFHSHVQLRFVICRLFGCRQCALGRSWPNQADPSIGAKMCLMCKTGRKPMLCRMSWSKGIPTLWRLANGRVKRRSSRRVAQELSRRQSNSVDHMCDYLRYLVFSACLKPHSKCSAPRRHLPSATRWALLA